MSLRRKILTFAAPAALLLASGCAQPFKANVARFQMMPPPAGQTFIVQATDPRLQGSIEFQTYAQQVAQRLTALGYRQGETGQNNLVVSVDYGVDNGHEEVVTTPALRPSWGWGYGWGPYRPYPLGWRGRYRGRYYLGWNDPFWYDPWGYPDVHSYTYFISHLDMQIRRASDGQMVFEGHARARSTDQSLTHLVPNLVEAMFTGFPGRSGEEVRITIPPSKPGEPPQPPKIEERRPG